MYCTCRVREVDDDVADLTETMSAFVEAEELGDCGGGVGEDLSWRNIRR